jgi:hypothetical protein
MIRASTMTILMIFGALCLTGSSAADLSVKESLKSWKPGQRIQVKLTSGGRAMGNLGEVHSDTFTLLPDKRSAASRELRFDDVQSAEKKWTKTTKWFTGLAIYGVLVGLGAIAGG